MIHRMPGGCPLGIRIVHAPLLRGPAHEAQVDQVVRTVPKPDFGHVAVMCLEAQRAVTPGVLDDQHGKSPTVWPADG